MSYRNITRQKIAKVVQSQPRSSTRLGPFRATRGTLYIQYLFRCASSCCQR